jgi:hypothetical protein
MRMIIFWKPNNQDGERDLEYERRKFISIRGTFYISVSVVLRISGFSCDNVSVVITSVLCYVNHLYIQQ